MFRDVRSCNDTVRIVIVCHSNKYLRVQLSKPKQVNGKPNKLPWKDAATYREVEKILHLPRFHVPAMDYSSGVAEVFVHPQTSEGGKRLGTTMLHASRRVLTVSHHQQILWLRTPIKTTMVNH